MKLPDAVRTADEFLEAHVVQHHGFAPSGELDDFVLDFHEAYAGDDGSVVLVFVVRPEVDPEEPPAEVVALARACCDALVAAHPTVDEHPIAFEFTH